MKHIGTLIKIQYRAADDKKLYEHEFKPDELADLEFSETKKEFLFPGIYTSKGIENMKHNPKNRFPIDGRKWYMNINTGSVDKGSNWIQEFKEADPDERHGWFDGLEEVPKPKKHKNPKKSKRTCKMSLAERKAWGKRMQSLRNAKKGKTKSNPNPKPTHKTLIPGKSIENNFRYFAKLFIEEYAAKHGTLLSLKKVITELKHSAKRDQVSAHQAFKNEISFLKY